MDSTWLKGPAPGDQVRSWECETRTAAGYLALNTLQHRQISCESPRSIIYVLCATKLQVQSFAGHFPGVCRSKRTRPARQLLPGLMPAAPGHCESTIGGGGRCRTSTMPSYGDPISGVLTLLGLRDFFVGLVGSPSQRRERPRHESALYRRP